MAKTQRLLISKGDGELFGKNVETLTNKDIRTFKKMRKEDALALARLIYDIYKEEKAVVKF